MTDYTITPSDALLIIDPQNDFCPGGALAVTGGDEIMPEIVKLAQAFYNIGAPIVVTQDYHPADHKSFASNHENAEPFSMTQMPYGPQVLWPDHCVQGTEGAEFHPDILPAVALATMIMRKGMNREVDSYSAYFENDKTTHTGLHSYMWEKKVRRVFVVGLAYDYCVAYTALDAKIRSGIEAVVVKDMTRAIDLNHSVAAMEMQLEQGGVTVIDSNQIKEG